jgi:hypothetical protein
MAVPRPIARFLAAAAVAVAAFLPSLPAFGQCTDACTRAAGALYLGDLNANGFVDQADLLVWEDCFQGATTVCPQADFNFDGIIDQIDKRYLEEIIALSGGGGAPAFPRVTLSEIRVRKAPDQTNPDIPQSRYVEIRTPAITRLVDVIVPGDPNVTAFGEGWYYIKACRSAPGSSGDLETVAGTIAVVQDLEGMPIIRPDSAASPTLPLGVRGLSLLADSSFAPPLSEAVPAPVRKYVVPAEGSLEVPVGQAAGRRFPPEFDTNVTHLLVYRDPNRPTPRRVPAVGQRINVRATAGGDDCRIAFDIAGGELPPWDVIVDAVTLVRGSDEPVYGCILATGPAALGPVGSVAAPFQPPHMYRCRNAGTVTRGPDAVVYIPQVPPSDTPFLRNPTCSTPVANCGELTGNGQPRSCFEVQATPFCSDPDCCIAVCEVTPTCCTEDWDAACVATAEQKCLRCGETETDCFAVHPTPSCGNAACCTAVCDVIPLCCDFAAGSWDEACVEKAKELCLGCGGSGAGSCTEAHPLPYCDDPSCCQRVCDVLPTCCTASWDAACASAAIALCPGCGRPGTGSCCVIHAGPFCENAACCARVCDLDPFCCQQNWDYFCTREAALQAECADLGCTCGEPPIPDPPGGFSCLVAHPLAGCEDSLCCQSVCIHDPYCCFISWDQACVTLATDECATDPRCIDPLTLLPVSGSCFVARPLSPGCSQPGCCSLVCADPDYDYCCGTDIGWDEACALRAAQVCDNCGDPLAGSCFQTHVGPYCANETCCRQVCAVDPFCCEGTWDSLCVLTAEVVCAGPIGSCDESVRSCFIPNYLPGCRGGTFSADPALRCCEGICASIDPFCCDARWDAVCAREASALCQASDRPDVPVGPGSCLESHATPACSNEECSRAVCSVDPQCCATGGAWDATCVLAAMAVCPVAGGCPAEGDCFSAHPSTAGCRDSSCCNGTCSVDPACCSASWDATCVSIARAVCQVPPDSGWSCPCAGSCFEDHENPGCDDGSCCAVVCNVSPVCCDQAWDADCVSFARTFCCGTPGCDSGCNKGCLSVHQEPYCDDAFCCDAVCRADPLCCLYSWDTLCVEAALERCAGACGLPTAGDCFVPQVFGGCRQASCCAKVCASDPTCCSEEWDELCVAAAIKNPDECKRRECGEYDAGPSCRAHPNGASEDADCCKAVCAGDAYCCEVEWDDACVDIARGIPDCGCTFECGDACAGDCCVAHANPSCDDEECCSQVCALDPYCCQVIWDAACAAEARGTCTGRKEACPVPPCGSDLLPSCCVPSNAPNCQNADCCTAVCQLDQFCCDIAWDVVCAQLALANPACGCDGLVCGDPNAGSCTQVRPEPYCSDEGCCVFVCDIDVSCCSLSWDEDCVLLAESFCVNGLVTSVPRTDRAGRDPSDRSRSSILPPSGWMPVRQRLQQRRPYPVDLEEDTRPVTEGLPVPRPPDRSPSLVPQPAPQAPAPVPSPAPEAVAPKGSPLPAAPTGKKPVK